MNYLKTFILLLILHTSQIFGQNNNPKIVLNHLMIVLDSATYQEILKSNFLSSNLAFSYEKKLKGYSGFYLIGQDNYIEIFNPKSIDNEINQVGTSWICYTSMKANYLKSINSSQFKSIEYSSDNDFNDLSLYFHDSTNLLTTWEMNKNHYENWSKKIFNDSVTYLSIDYNSPAESDSSKNYLFKNIEGFKAVIDNSDSVKVETYLELIGYKKTINKNNIIRYSNSFDFIEIDFQKDIKIPRITTIYFKLNRQTKSQQFQIGNSILLLNEDSGIWRLNE